MNDIGFDPLRVKELIQRLGDDADSTRKMAAFQLSERAGDPSFADLFISEGGLQTLRFLILKTSTGNTLAYALSAFSRLLEVDRGWDCIDVDMVKRIVEFVVEHKMINTLRGAMSVLVATVSQTYTSSTRDLAPGVSQAVRHAIVDYPNFLPKLVDRLSSDDNTMCMNALQLINSLMRDAIANDPEWHRFIRRLHDLGTIRAVYSLMQGSALQDLAQPLLEFQTLTKVILKEWAALPVDFERPDHRRIIKTIHSRSKLDPEVLASGQTDSDPKAISSNEKWRRLGFEITPPADEFGEMGYLGMMDLAGYVQKLEDGFSKLILEQGTEPDEKQCPLAKASIAVTGMLYDIFAIDKADIDDAKAFIGLDSRTNIDKYFKPMLLQWTRLHTTTTQAFLRFWKLTGAVRDEFSKIADLVNILAVEVFGNSERVRDIADIEQQLLTFDYQKLRELQMQFYGDHYERLWGDHFQHINEVLNAEALQFIKEQRIRCLLAGCWFPISASETQFQPVDHDAGMKWRFVRLNYNRRFLHFQDFDVRELNEPSIKDLSGSIDLRLVSSVIGYGIRQASSPTSSSTALESSGKPDTQSRITILAVPARPPADSDRRHHRKTSSTASTRKETPVLTLYPPTRSQASEWLDGLLFLLDKSPITAETIKLINLVSCWSMRIRLLPVRMEEGKEVDMQKAEVPSREGLDTDYYYDAGL